ncbi:MAG: polysaccharide pyruvyl transferase CsaB [Firmicutes bacterium]|nr:polysaccharide pyruvyl transferase CsaB [Bacillota bacterium]
MQTVVLSGYYGFDNAGDEALLWSITSKLRELRPGIRVIVLSANPSRTGELYGVEAVPRANLPVLLKCLARADLLISGGGSLLQDVTSWRSIVYYLGVIALARLLGTPVMYYAQGVGPINRRWTRWLTRVISDRASLITLRDRGSLQELEGLGVKRPPMIVTADPVLGLEPTPVGGRSRVNEDAARLPVVGISLRQWGRQDGYKRVVAEAADFLSGRGWEVVFLPFHHPDDVQASLEVAAMMKRGSRVMEERFTASALLEQVGGLSLLIGMRLHSLIFAAVNGVPMLGISYDPKVDSFLAGIGRAPVGSVNDLLMRDMFSRLEQMLGRLDQERDYVLSQAEALRERANQTARLALKLLDNPKLDLVDDCQAVKTRYSGR